MRIRLLALTMLVFGGTIEAAPLTIPPTVIMTPPVADLPLDVAAFSGIWEGVWENVLPSRLAVEELTRDSAVVVYAYADDPQGRFPGGWGRYRVQVLPGGTLRWSNAQGTLTFTFTLTQDHRHLEGQKDEAGAIAHVR